MTIGASPRARPRLILSILSHALALFVFVASIPLIVVVMNGIHRLYGSILRGDDWMMNHHALVIAAILGGTAGSPLLARLDSLVSCPGLSNDTLSAAALSTALVAMGTVLLVVLWRTRSGSSTTTRDEYVLIAVIAVIVVAVTAFWPIASAADDWASVLRGVDAGRCIPLSVSGPVLWILAIAPIGAPVLDGIGGVLVWHRTRTQWFPAFSVAASVFFAAVLIGFSVIGSQLPAT